jgi:hypothetical protein
VQEVIDARCSCRQQGRSRAAMNRYAMRKVVPWTCMEADCETLVNVHGSQRRPSGSVSTADQAVGCHTRLDLTRTPVLPNLLQISSQAFLPSPRYDKLVAAERIAAPELSSDAPVRRSDKVTMSITYAHASSCENNRHRPVCIMLFFGQTFTLACDVSRPACRRALA